MQTLKLINTSFLKIRHEHILPKDDNLQQGSLETAIIQIDTTYGM